MQWRITNNLLKHIEDFKSIISGNRLYIEQFILRMRRLIDIGIISEEFDKPLERFEERYSSEELKNIVWLGFLFADEEIDKTDKYNEKLSEIPSISFDVDFKIKHILLPSKYEDYATKANELISDKHDTIEKYLENENQ